MLRDGSRDMEGQMVRNSCWALRRQERHEGRELKPRNERAAVIKTVVNQGEQSERFECRVPP